MRPRRQLRYSWLRGAWLEQRSEFGRPVFWEYWGKGEPFAGWYQFWP